MLKRIVHRITIASLSLFFISSPVFSEDLEDIYELALKNDPLLRSAEATYRSNMEYKSQGRAGLLPSLSISGSTNWNEYRDLKFIDDTLVDKIVFDTRSLFSKNEFRNADYININ